MHNGLSPCGRALRRRVRLRERVSVARTRFEIPLVRSLRQEFLGAEVPWELIDGGDTELTAALKALSLDRRALPLILML
jgi:hypothetical protein